MASTPHHYLAEGASAGTRRESVIYLASGTIVAGDVVMFDPSKTGTDRALFVIQAGNVGTGNALACGVALGSASAGERVEVVIAGYVEGVNCTAGTIVAGAALAAASAAAGQVETSAPGDTAGIFGVAIEAKGAVTANKVAILVKRQH